MSETKKQRLKRWRLEFNEKCLARDDGKCVICGQPAVDVHHITDRHLMPNDGYAPENGASLCSACHSEAEDYHRVKPMIKVGYRASDRHLYKLIDSSHEKALIACRKLE